MDVDSTANKDTNSYARAYIEEGLAVLPAHAGEKEAKIKDWPQLILGPDAVAEYFPPGVEKNIVRVNGTNSGGRGDIDLDRSEALRVANYIVPEDTLRFGREGQVPGHVEVRFADTVPRTTRYELPGEGDDRCVVELRADGSQTLLPPSTYPNGDLCVWHDGEVLEAHAVTLRGYVEDIAVAALLLMHYPGEGARQQFWLGAIGMLIKARHPIERVRRIVEATVRCANDPELRTRLRVIDTSMTKHLLGDRIAGKKKLGSVAPEVPQVLKEWLGIGKITDSGLPHVVTNDRPLREVSDEATDALVAANEPPEVFARSGILARLAQDAEGRPVIQDIDKDRLRYRMTRTAEYLKVSDEIAHVYPPEAVVSDVLAAKAFSFPELVGITQSPALRQSGTILNRPGYDKETRLVYVPKEEVEIDVPFEPTEDEVKASVALLKEVYTDFPFVDESSFANMVALTITPIARPAYTGPTPLAVIDKPSMGTGASLLSEVVCAIATAQPAAMMSPPDSDEETRKQITAVLRTGRPIIVVDNLGSELKNASWARVLTSTTWEDRILGHSKVATLPQRSTWIVTGNNVRIGGDIPRRCFWIRMDAKMSKPWDRPPEEFAHPDLLGWVAENRAKLLGAILTLARHWFAVGAPQWSGRPPGSFEGWARVVGGILEAGGIPGFLGNTTEMLERTSAGVSEWEAFLSTWRETYEGSGVTAKGLVAAMQEEEDNPLRDVLPAELAVPLSEGSAMLPRKFGEAFSAKEGVRYGEGGLHLARAGLTRNKVVLWKVLGTAQPDPNPEKEDKPQEDVEAYNVRGRGVSRGLPTSAPGNSGSSEQVVTGELQKGTKIINFPELRSDDPSRPRDPAATYTLVDNEERLDQCVRAVEACDRVGLDTETTGLGWWEARVRIISLSTDAGETFVVDVDTVNPEPLYRVLEGVHLVVHNAVFDIPFLKRAECNPGRASCTKVLSQLRWGGREDVQHALGDVIKRHAPKHEAKGEVDHEAWGYSTIPEEALEYAANDAKPLLTIYDDELRVLEYVEMLEVAALEERFLAVVIEASEVGIPVNPEKWDAVVEESVGRKCELAKQLDLMLPGDIEVPDKFAKANTGRDDIAKINWSSPDQKVWAIEYLGLEVPTKWDHKKKQNKKTLDKDHLHLVGHPIAEGLGEYQAIANFPATFARALKERFDDGWIYPAWQQLRARTGRMSCQSPPMHNMPKKSKLREAIVAPDGHKIIALDFSQMEPRVLAALSKDRALLKAFKEGKDVYRFVASKVTGVPTDEVPETLRGIFKTIVLGLIYGMGEHGLALRVHRDVNPDIPEERIVAYRDGFFAAFPEAAKWRDDLEAEFHNGSTETRTIIGRRRMNVETPRQRWNAPIQGSATDAFKQSAVDLYERSAEVGGFRIVALIHDEVVLLVAEDRAGEVEEWARKVMSQAAADVVNAKLPKNLHIPIAVDSGIGDTLQEAKDAS